MYLDWLEKGMTDAVHQALREAAEKWRKFCPRCPTCEMASRETKDMVCQTCGKDYGRAA